MNQRPKSDIFPIDEAQIDDKRKLYAELAIMCAESLKELIDARKMFKEMYCKEYMNNDKGQEKTLEIIRNLTKRIDDEKAEYIRFSAVASGDRQP